MTDPIDKSRDDEFREKLTPQQYAVTREGGTEPAFSGEYEKDEGAGTYSCVCCQSALFSGKHKFDSGSGWPSYFQPTSDESIKEVVDGSHGMQRTEVRCATCDAHLGHVFPDGPAPTRLRYCINSLALSKASK